MARATVITSVLPTRGGRADMSQTCASIVVAEAVHIANPPALLSSSWRTAVEHPRGVDDRYPSCYMWNDIAVTAERN